MDEQVKQLITQLPTITTGMITQRDYGVFEPVYRRVREQLRKLADVDAGQPLLSPTHLKKADPATPVKKVLKPRKVEKP